MRLELAGAAIVLLCLVMPAAATEHSSLIYSTSPHYPDRWLWEPIGQLRPASAGVNFGPQTERGQQLTLQPGGVALFRLPADYWLRLDRADSAETKAPAGAGPASPVTPELWHSLGNGLFVPKRLQHGSRAGEWLLPPTQSSEALLMLENSGEESVRWWLSRTTPERGAALYPYREIAVSQHDKPQWYYQENRGNHLQMSALVAGEQYRIALQGPGQWRLESRILPGAQQGWQRFVDLPLRLNNKYWRDWRLHPRVDYRAPMQSGQCKRLSGAAESLYISLPEGNYDIDFTAPQDMAVRMLALPKDDFMLARNQPDPSVAELNDQLDLDPRPSAQPRYNEALFHTLLGARYPTPPMPTYAEQLDRDLAPDYAADQLVDQRYRFWRALPVAAGELAPIQANLVDVALADPLRGNKRYLTPALKDSDSLQSLLPLPPGQEIKLHAPAHRDRTILKLALPITTTSYHLTMKNRRGETTQWRFRPDLIEANNLDLENDRDLPSLMPNSKDTEVAISSATFTVEDDDWPISLSHSAGEVIWFSPLYRDNVPSSLSQAGWERALAELGVDEMLALLINDAPPVHPGAATAQQQLQLQVWNDWKPLRNWLYSYRQIWNKGLSSGPTTEQAPDQQQLSRLSERTDIDADYLLEQVQRGIAVRDPDPAQRQMALQWLKAHYSRTADTANLSAYHSWHFQQAPAQQMQALADWLLIANLEAMALRLYRLADTPPGHLPYQQARLDNGWQLDQTAMTSVISTWEAIWAEDWTAALQHSAGLEQDDPWRHFLSKAPDNRDPVSWLQWAREAPVEYIDGVPARTSMRLAASGSAGTEYLYATQRELHMQRPLARPDTPVHYTVIGPVDLEVAVNLRHSDPQEILDDWVEITDNGSKRWLPVIDSRVNPGITQLPQATPGNIGSAQRLTLALGPGRHELSIRPLQHPALVDAKIQSPLLLSHLIDSFQQTPPTPPTTSLRARQLITGLDITTLSECQSNEPESQNSALTSPQSSEFLLSAIPLATQWQAPHTLSLMVPPGSGGLVAGDYVEEYLLQLLRQWPKTGDKQRRELIARANASAAPYLRQAGVGTLLRKLNQGYGWQREEAITASSGSQRIAASSSSEHPVVIEREKLLIGATAPPGERLHGFRTIGFFTQFNDSKEVRLQLTQVHLPHHEAPPARVLITLNETPLRTVTLPPLQQQITITVPGGPQHLRLRLEQPSSDQWLYVQAHAHLAGQWQSLLQPRQRRYQVATRQQPLEMYIPEPRWLRVDEYRDGNVVQHYQWHSQPGPLQLPPPPDQNSAMYRVFSWQPQTTTSSLQPYPFVLAKNDPPDATGHSPTPGEATAPLPADYQLPPQPWFPDQRPPGSASSTDSIYLELRSRLDLDSDSSGASDERFVEAGWQHRRALDCLACYWRSELFARKHDDDNIDVLGTQQKLQGDWEQSSWRWELGQSMWLQTKPKTDWAWQGSATAIDTHDINEKLEHEYDMQLFDRYLSADSPDYPVDNNIYTQYKDQHQYGLKLGATLRGRPWLDSLWTARAALGTNEDFNPLQPDFVQASAVWRQYWYPLAFSGEIRHRLYLADNDRDNDINRPALALAVNSLTPIQAGEFLQWAASIDYDLDREKYGFMLGVSWDFSRGRGLKDFYPGSSSFYSLRSRDLDAYRYKNQLSNEPGHE